MSVTGKGPIYKSVIVIDVRSNKFMQSLPTLHYKDDQRELDQPFIEKASTLKHPKEPIYNNYSNNFPYRTNPPKQPTTYMTQTNLFLFKNGIRVKEMNGSCNKFSRDLHVKTNTEIKNENYRQEASNDNLDSSPTNVSYLNTDNNYRNSIMGSNAHNSSNSYIFDEKKIASYDLTQNICDRGAESNSPNDTLSNHKQNRSKNIKKYIKKTAQTTNYGEINFNRKRLRKKLRDNLMLAKKNGLNYENGYHDETEIYSNNKLMMRNPIDCENGMSSVSLSDYQFTLDCMNTSESNSYDLRTNCLADVESISAPNLKANSKLRINPNESPQLLTNYTTKMSNCCSRNLSYSDENNENNDSTYSGSSSSNSSTRGRGLAKSISRSNSSRSRSSSTGKYSSCSNHSKINTGCHTSMPFPDSITHYEPGCEMSVGFDEPCEQPSVEFARADDIKYDLNNENVKSSDDEFTYSYGDILNSKSNRKSSLSIKSDTKEDLKTNNPKTDASVAPEIESFETLNLIVHRLPGEKLGMSLKWEKNGSVHVVNVTENSAADRASDAYGNRRPIKVNDEILEINGASLNNMISKDDDIISLVQELPLYVSLILRRKENDNISVLSPNEKENESNSSCPGSPNIANIKIPVGYNLHTIYLSSLESKCIMPCDLKDSSDAEGLYQIQKNTLQIGEEDHLQKGDVLYNINGEQLAYKNKFDLISKLSNLGGIAEVSVLRKTNTTCYGTNSDKIPYHNGIFAQNSIKLAMRRYEKPALKCNSETEIFTNNNLLDSQKNHSLNHLPSDITPTDPVQQTTDESKKNSLSTDNDLAVASYHSENWLFCEKKQPSANVLASCSLVSNLKDSPFHTNNEFTFKNSASNNATDSIKKNDESFIDLNNLYILNDSDQAGQSRDYQDGFYYNDMMPTTTTESDKSRADMLDKNDDETYGEDSIIKTNRLNSQEPQNPTNFYFEDATARTLTSSSCHSERSVVQLNCAVCYQEKPENPTNSPEVIKEDEQIENTKLDSFDCNYTQTSNHCENECECATDQHESDHHLKSSQCLTQLVELKEDNGIDLINTSKYTPSQSPTPSSTSENVYLKTITKLQPFEISNKINENYQNTLTSSSSSLIHYSFTSETAPMRQDSDWSKPVMYDCSLLVSSSSEPSFNKFVSKCEIEIKNPVESVNKKSNIKYFTINNHKCNPSTSMSASKEVLPVENALDTTSLKMDILKSLSLNLDSNDGLGNQKIILKSKSLTHFTFNSCTMSKFDVKYYSLPDNFIICGLNDFINQQFNEISSIDDGYESEITGLMNEMLDKIESNFQIESLNTVDEDSNRIVDDIICKEVLDRVIDEIESNELKKESEKKVKFAQDIVESSSESFVSNNSVEKNDDFGNLKKKMHNELSQFFKYSKVSPFDKNLSLTDLNTNQFDTVSTFGKGTQSSSTTTVTTLATIDHKTNNSCSTRLPPTSPSVFFFIDSKAEFNNSKKSTVSFESESVSNKDIQMHSFIPPLNCPPTPPPLQNFLFGSSLNLGSNRDDYSASSLVKLSDSTQKSTKNDEDKSDSIIKPNFNQINDLCKIDLSNRFSTMITARPFQPIQKGKILPNNTLMINENFSSNQTLKCTKYFLNDHLKSKTTPKQLISSLFLNDDQLLNPSFIKSGINTLKHSTSINYKHENSIKDYVESAFEKQIKQKIINQNQHNNTINNNNQSCVYKQPSCMDQTFSTITAAVTGNGLVADSLKLNKNIELYVNTTSTVSNQNQTTKSEISLSLSPPQPSNQASIREKIYKLTKEKTNSASDAKNPHLNVISQFKNSSVHFNDEENLNKQQKRILTNTKKANEFAEIRTSEDQTNHDTANDNSTDESVENFQSVKDKIAFFSKKTIPNGAATTTTATVSVPGGFMVKNNHKLTTNEQIMCEQKCISINTAGFLDFKNNQQQYQIITSSNQQALQMSTCQDYDSLKNAYKSLNNNKSTFFRAK